MPTGPSSDVNLGPLGASFNANDWEENFVPRTAKVPTEWATKFLIVCC